MIELCFGMDTKVLERDSFRSADEVTIFVRAIA